MEFRGSSVPQSEEEIDLKRGPWTVEEDLILMNYIAVNGEGKWNSLARCAGLRRTGKSCRLRWLNYLRPDVRRGNITPEEQFLILELHSRWGNRWSKIAQYLPGRTDNEIKNYWRTRVQKHAKQLKCDVDSKQFKDVMRYLWMPRLLERIRAASGDSYPCAAGDSTAPMSCGGAAAAAEEDEEEDLARLAKMMSPENSSAAGTSASVSASLESSIGIQFSPPAVSGGECSGGGGDVTQLGGDFWSEEPLAWLPSPDGAGQADLALPELDQAAWGESLWSVEDIWLQQQF